MGDLPVRLRPHAAARLAERSATEAEAMATVETGENYPAKHGRTAFRRNSVAVGPAEHDVDTKQLEVYAVEEDGDCSSSPAASSSSEDGP